MTIYRHSYNFETKELTTKECEAIQRGTILTIRIPNESDCNIEASKLNSNLFGIPKKSWAAMDRGECGEAYMFCESSDPASFITAIKEYCQGNVVAAEKVLLKAKRTFHLTKENMDIHIKTLDELLTDKAVQEEQEFGKRDLTKMIQNLGFKEYICTSFGEAEHNSRKKNIVIIDNAEIYLTYKYNGEFGEFLCWSEYELKESPAVYDAVGAWVLTIYGSDETRIDADVKHNCFPCPFTPYEEAELER